MDHSREYKARSLPDLAPKLEEDVNSVGAGPLQAEHVHRQEKRLQHTHNTSFHLGFSFYFRKIMFSLLRKLL